MLHRLMPSTKKDFGTEAKVWNEMKMHIYVIADVFANGIVKQFGTKK